jgi:hypothetical protein
VIIPSRDLVITRLGHASPLDDAFDAYLDRTVGDILAAISE